MHTTQVAALPCDAGAGMGSLTGMAFLGKQMLTADSGEQNPQLICLKQGSLRFHLCDNLTRPSLGKLGEKRREEKEREKTLLAKKPETGSKPIMFPSLKLILTTLGNTSTHHCWQVVWALALGKESSTQWLQTLYTDSHIFKMIH